MVAIIYTANDDVYPLKRAEALPTEVARLLRASIEQGQFRPGEKLPTQQALGDTYGVSRSVIREAVSLLKSDGLVISQQGRGQFVNPEGSSVFRLDADIEDANSLPSLIEFLVSVESQAAGYAARRRSTEQLAEITRCLDALSSAIADKRDGIAEDMRFHRAILAATQNEYFIGFGDFLEARVRGLIRTARINTARQGDLVYEVQREHEAIHAAIAVQDVEAAQYAAQRHLQNAAARLSYYQAAQTP